MCGDDEPELHNRVELDHGRLDGFGLPGVVTHYTLSENSRRIGEAGLEKATELCYAAGADCYLVKPEDFDGLLHMVRCLDECLQQQPSSLSALREVSPHADLARDALRIELREGLARHRKLMEEQRAHKGRLDTTMAEQKESKKKFPFVPKERQRPKDG